jgi:hypothetical protein
LNNPLEGLKTSLKIEPTLRFSMETVDSPALAQFLDRLGAIKIPVLPRDSHSGLDGTSFGLRIPSARLEISWWENGPKDWEELTTLMNELARC